MPTMDERWAMMLDTLDEQSWSRTADHTENGVVTLDKMLQIYSNHGEKHCTQILGLRDKMDW